MLSWPRDGGADRLLLEVREDNAGALAFYAARGFVEIDRRPRYYRDGATAVVLALGCPAPSWPERAGLDPSSPDPVGPDPSRPDASGPDEKVCSTT